MFKYAMTNIPVFCNMILGILVPIAPDTAPSSVGHEHKE